MSKAKAIGCFVGLFIGDALGTTLEFKERDSYTHLTDMVGGGPFGLEPGRWTDDGSMALALADSILQKGTIDKVDLITRFCNWAQYGEYSHNGKCFDIGNTTSRALNHFLRSGVYADAPNDPNQAGNGSIMRLAPVPIRWHNDYETGKEMALASGIVTHGSDIAQDYVLRLYRMLWDLIKGLLFRMPIMQFYKEFRGMK